MRRWLRLLRPRLLFEGARAAAALAPRDWWRSPPFLPRPDRRYLRWRVHTAYGDPDTPTRPEDIAEYLAWRGRMRRARH